MLIWSDGSAACVCHEQTQQHVGKYAWMWWHVMLTIMGFVSIPYWASLAIVSACCECVWMMAKLKIIAYQNAKCIQNAVGLHKFFTK